MSSPLGFGVRTLGSGRIGGYKMVYVEIHLRGIGQLKIELVSPLNYLHSSDLGF